MIHGNFSFFVQLDHTFQKVPSHGGKQLHFSVLPQVAGVEGFAPKNEVSKNLDAKIVLGKLRKSCQTTGKTGRIFGILANAGEEFDRMAFSSFPNAGCHNSHARHQPAESCQTTAKMTHAAKEAGTSKDRGFHNTRPPSPRLRRTGMDAEKDFSLGICVIQRHSAAIPVLAAAGRAGRENQKSNLLRLLAKCLQCNGLRLDLDKTIV
ncbi:MAG: hypothetical protein ABSA47_12630 [Verrucomicrobiota bacterium]|jgi:hypothetical protein